jgi:hypothetical protein
VYCWDIYRAAARARYVGQVIAADADEAIESAAVGFRTDIKKLIAVRRYEIAWRGPEAGPPGACSTGQLRLHETRSVDALKSI